ncbi:hydrogenase accessory protein HypB [Anoxybacter fermentans]|uniref:Hydrogenase accessory protein HypB n=1 Tax=Anoxybacter fermentans TaxID=1323375 RepID=A0A3S9T2R2_9FIRM|nr:hydrogenase nickel incorporation protein HypB [Anoxybacter fermentans]AZR74839.1 hydrogenase accessory protein HypB [Anoxybacter fermentans]
MKKIKIVKSVLKANDRVSEQNRQIFDQHNLLVMNVIGSPGAGKTTLLEGLIKRVKDRLKIAVIEGDIFTIRDAKRIEACGVDVVQINTGGGCHLDAVMVQEALENLNLNKLDLLVIENVGNLVCPAAFNLGEDFKMVVMSITEGDDKPEKYPRIFQESKVLVVTKIDLLKYNQFDMERFLNEVKGIQPDIEIFKVSSIKGEGLDELVEWIIKQLEVKKSMSA